MLKILFSWLKGGKTNTAMIVLVVVYFIQKYVGIETSEAEVATQLGVILGIIGQVHKMMKSPLAKKIKDKVGEDKEEKK